MKKMIMILLICFLIVGCSQKEADYLTVEKLIKKLNLKKSERYNGMELDIPDFISVYENERGIYYVALINNEIISVSYLAESLVPDKEGDATNKYKDEIAREINLLLPNEKEVIKQAVKKECQEFKYHGNEALIKTDKGFTSYDIVYDIQKFKNGYDFDLSCNAKE